MKKRNAVRLAIAAAVAAVLAFSLPALLHRGGDDGAPGRALATISGRILFGHSGDIWVAEAGGTYPLTQGGRYWGQPDWSPDGAPVVLVGWGRTISRSTSLRLEAGPRIGEDGGLDAEANATFSQRWPNSIATSVTYSRTQLTLPTQTEPSNAQALGLQVTAAPLRALTLALTADVSSVKQKDETISAGAGLSAAYRLTKWLSAVASYRFNRSETRGVAIDHSLVSIGLQARYPTRLDD